MTSVIMEFPDIPHGHGLSFKKGVADGLLESRVHEDSVHQTHSASYERGVAAGKSLRFEIGKLVKP